MEQKLTIATRGSALALAQSRLVEAEAQKQFPGLQIEIQIIKTTGDKLQSVSLSNPDVSLPRGLFTKELEVALLNGQADLAVHSLKDLPTELAPSLMLGAVLEREDVRDVLVVRRDQLSKNELSPLSIKALKENSRVGTSSNRRSFQILACNGAVKVIPIRGNVGTRLQKLSDGAQFDAIILAAAGLNRLGITITPSGDLVGREVPPGLIAAWLPLEEMLPAVGQGAIGLEICRENQFAVDFCNAVNHDPTFRAVLAERSFLRAMGGGCQSPVAALASTGIAGLHLQVVSFMQGRHSRGELTGPAAEADSLGETLAGRVLKNG